MNRRDFIRRLVVGAAGAVVLSTLPASVSVPVEVRMTREQLLDLVRKIMEDAISYHDDQLERALFGPAA